MFSLRIVTVDHYQGTPVNGLDPQYSTFRGAPVKRVPVLRIFGATPAGEFLLEKLAGGIIIIIFLCIKNQI